METIKAIIRKEFLHVLRDKRTLKLIIFMPLIMDLTRNADINPQVKMTVGSR